MTPRINAVTVGTAIMANSRHRTRQLPSAIRPGLRGAAPADTALPKETSPPGAPAPRSLPGGPPGRGPSSAARGGLTGTGSPSPGPPKEPPAVAGPGPTASPAPGLPLPFSGTPEDGGGVPFPLVVGRLRTALTPRSFKGITKRV